MSLELKAFDPRERTARAAVLSREELRRAFERREFEVYYQPVVALSTGRLSGFEALARWRHPVRGVVGPSEFIPLAEEARLLTEIGGWVLEEACRQTCEWRELIPSQQHLTVGVNLSFGQLARPDLVGRVRRTLRETGLPPDCLKLEVSESDVASNADAAAPVLMRLRALGVRLSIDDFGTGLASPSYLRRIPVDTLKVDRPHVALTADGGDGGETVRAAVALASALGAELVAEGVEAPEQHARLEALGCEYAQGFLYSEPVDAESALSLIRVGVRTPRSLALAREEADRSLFRLAQVLAA
jgi:EAL domain-containing protein (putative c-di-GMP-specific phosphodiesterase class I)